MKVLSELLLFAPLGVAAFTAPQHQGLIKTASPTHTSLSVASGFGGDSGGDKNPLGFLFKSDSFEDLLTSRPKTTVIDPDYRLAWTFAFSALAIFLFYPADKMCYANNQICAPTLVGGVCAFLHAWFAIFLADRTSRIRIVFDEKNFQMMDIYDQNMVVQKKSDSMKLRKKNYVVGGPNKWNYDSFVNFDFFPSVNFPILVYFKETQTPESKWVVGPGKYDPVGGGMVHFFPAFGNPYQIKREFEKRCKNVKK